jgi:hypothetical protein
MVTQAEIEVATIERCKQLILALKRESASPSWNGALDEAADTLEMASRAPPESK